MINVKYVAPLANNDLPPTQPCGIDPYSMLAISPGRSTYVVETQNNWEATGITEGDLLVVDERASPTDGSICIFVVNDSLQICTVHDLDGTLWPRSINGKIDAGMHIEYCGTVVRMMRMLHD